MNGGGPIEVATDAAEDSERMRLEDSRANRAEGRVSSPAGPTWLGWGRHGWQIALALAHGASSLAKVPSESSQAKVPKRKFQSERSQAKVPKRKIYKRNLPGESFQVVIISESFQLEAAK